MFKSNHFHYLIILINILVYSKMLYNNIYDMFTFNLSFVLLKILHYRMARNWQSASLFNKVTVGKGTSSSTTTQQQHTRVELILSVIDVMLSILNDAKNLNMSV